MVQVISSMVDIRTSCYAARLAAFHVRRSTGKRFFFEVPLSAYVQLYLLFMALLSFFANQLTRCHVPAQGRLKRWWASWICRATMVRVRNTLRLLLKGSRQEALISRPSRSVTAGRQTRK